MTISKYTLDPQKSQLPTFNMSIVLILALLTHYAVLYVAMPALNNLLRWIVPSRYGNGTDTLLNPAEFMNLSFWFIAGMVVLFGFTAVFVRLKKDVFALISILLFFTLTLAYFGLVLGNVAGDLWGGWAAAAAVILGFATVFVFEMPILRAYSIGKKTTKK